MNSTGIKYNLKKAMQYLPDNGRWLKKQFYASRLIQRKFQVKLKNVVLDSEIPSPETVYWINPDRIIFHTNYKNKIHSKDFADRVFDKNKDTGKVYGGDWDNSKYKFSDLDIYQAIENRIRDNMPWEETRFYKNNVSKINDPNNNQILWNCRTQGDFDSRCQYLDELISSIETQGFKQNYQVKLSGEEDGLHKNPDFSDEISVNVSRDGQYLFQDGRHRLAIAKILGVEKIPVKVHVRHKRWMEFRRFLISMTEDNAGASKQGSLYQPAIHPDLQDIPASHDCENRFIEISKQLNKSSGNLLDLGSNFGYFCHRFEELGFNCYGVEYMPEIAEAAEKLRVAEGRHFKLFSGDLSELCVNPPLKDIHFDVVLALNIFHHFLKTEELYTKLIKLLQTLDMKVMYFEAHRFDEPQMKNSFVNYHEEEFVNFILSNSTLRKSTPIHTCDDQRKIYKLEN